MSGGPPQAPQALGGEVIQSPATAPERLSATELRTNVAPPRQRVFLPESIFDRLRGMCWTIVRVTLFRWSPPAARTWRNLLLGLFGAKIGRNVFIAHNARIDYPWNLRLDDDVVICDHVIINCMGEVTVGERTRISQYSHLCAGTHEYQRRDMRIKRCPIVLGCNVWIAADAFVGPGVTIGDGCMLAARSSAFHDLPPNQICVGECAAPVRERFAGHP